MIELEEKNSDELKGFGSGLRMLRRRQRMPQAVFAKSLGISQGYLSDLERGNKRPSDTLLIALTSRYGTLPGPTGTMPESGPTGTIPLLGGIDTKQHPEDIPGTVLDRVRLPEMDGGRFAIVAAGNFMAPTIADGDLVILAPVTEVASGEIVLLTSKWGEAILRRYRVMGEKVLYTADNSTYQPFSPTQETRVLAKVVAVWRSVLFV